MAKLLSKDIKMKYLICGKSSRSYGYVVSGVINKNTGKLEYTDFKNKSSSVDFLKLKKKYFSVGDVIVGNEKADDEYFHTNSKFVGVILEVTDKGTLLVTGYSGRPQNKIKAVVDPEFFNLVQVFDVVRAVKCQFGHPIVAKQEPLSQEVADIILADVKLQPNLKQKGAVAPAAPVAPPNLKKVEPKSHKGFTVGDKVMLSSESMFNDGSPANPLKLVGVVKDIVKGNLPISVTWDNGFANSYLDKDLIKEG